MADFPQPPSGAGESLTATRPAAANCHSGEYFTDGQVHELGLTNEYDRYQGSNTPSLLGVGQRIVLMHDGRATEFG